MVVDLISLGLFCYVDQPLIKVKLPLGMLYCLMTILVASLPQKQVVGILCESPGNYSNERQQLYLMKSELIIMKPSSESHLYQTSGKEGI